MSIIVDFAYVLAGVAISPMVIYRAIRHKRYRRGWSDRFGRIIRKDPVLKRCIWLHAVSVGEVNASRTVIEELVSRFPDYEIVLTTTTDTGFARASALFGANHTVSYFPLDFSRIIRRVFHSLRPTLCLLMELEVWPNFVLTARELGVPVIVLNGRVTERSCSRYKKIRPFAKHIFQKVSLILAQTEEYAQRFREIGAAEDRVIVTGSLKYDTAQIADKVEGSDKLASKLNIRNERLWVAGGTGPGEEEIILDVFGKLTEGGQFGDLRVAIVPRKPERFGEVAQLISEAGFEVVRYSSLKDGQGRLNEKTPVILGDTMGDLRKFYSLATVIFAGRSLVPMGGSDMIEAAALGKCTMFGPHTFNFKQTVHDLLNSDGGIEIRDAAELLDMMRKCLSEPDFARTIGENGREVIRQNQGATEKSINQIARFLSAGH